MEFEIMADGVLNVSVEPRCRSVLKLDRQVAFASVVHAPGGPLVKGSGRCHVRKDGRVPDCCLQTCTCFGRA
eukprot:6358687-Pyramimonas_sp.AAC.1